jgi:hypothetical protein
VRNGKVWSGRELWITNYQSPSHFRNSELITNSWRCGTSTTNAWRSSFTLLATWRSSRGRLSRVLTLQVAITLCGWSTGFPTSLRLVHERVRCRERVANESAVVNVSWTCREQVVNVSRTKLKLIHRLRFFVVNES